MFRQFRPAAVGLVTLAAASLPACSGDDSQPVQDTAGGGAPSPALGTPLPTSPDSLRAEFMGLQQRLNGIQQQALQDSVLQDGYAKIQTMVEEAMATADPQLTEHRDRLGAIQQELDAAQQAGQSDKLQPLIEEGTSIQNRLRQVQQEALALEEVKTKMDAFRETVVARMAEIDPEAPAIMDRANAIAEQLNARAIAPGTAEPGGPADDE